MTTTTQPLAAALAASADEGKNFKKLLLDQLRAGGGIKNTNTKQLFQILVKDTLEAFLELEMEEHLGYAKHSPGGSGSRKFRHFIPVNTFD